MILRTVYNALYSLAVIILSWWWFIIPAILFLVFLDLWLFYRRQKYENSIKWKLLELKPPRDVLQTPKAMEQVFTSFHAIQIRQFIEFLDKWLGGKVENRLSLEIVGHAHGSHFYVRTPETYRNLVESAVYAQYPDAEITEVEDYIHHFPPRLPDKTYDVWGTDFILSKPNPYPIRTYEHFEDLTEERRLDPISAVTEAMSKLKGSEAIWLQFIIRPADDVWKKEADVIIDELMGKKKAKKKPTSWLAGLIHEIQIFLKNLFFAAFEHPTWPDDVAKEEKKEAPDTKPGDKKLIDEILKKLSKLAFESVLRFVYIDRRDAFTRSNVAAVVGALRQFNAPSLNSFRMNKYTLTYGMRLKSQRRKRFLYDNYRVRHFPKKYSILNTEELATVFHFPITGVRAPLLRRVESKKGGPPEGLPLDIS